MTPSLWLRLCAVFRPQLWPGYDWIADGRTRRLLERLDDTEQRLQRERDRYVDVINERDGWRLRAEQLGGKSPMMGEERVAHLMGRRS